MQAYTLVEDVSDAVGKEIVMLFWSFTLFHRADGGIFNKTVAEMYQEWLQFNVIPETMCDYLLWLHQNREVFDVEKQTSQKMSF